MWRPGSVNLRGALMYKRFAALTIVFTMLIPNPELYANSLVASNRLPSRSACIVKLVLNWPKLAEEEKQKIMNQMGEAIALSSVRGGPRVETQSAFLPGRYDSIYIQFNTNCQSRFSLAHELVKYIKRSVIDAPHIVVSTKRVDPGPNTIDAWGPYWKDQPQKLPK